MSNSTVKNTVLIFLLCTASFCGQATGREDLLNQYENTGTTPFSETRGQMLWQQTVDGEAPYRQRSCTTCHGKDLKSDGKHIRTNKVIKALAPSANSSSLVKARKIEKWFLRNCKWTFGRECSAQEKGDILTYLKNQ